MTMKYMLVLLLPILIRVISILDNNSLLMMSPFEYLADRVSSLALDHGNQSRKSDDYTCNSNCIILSDTDVLVPCLCETMNPEPLSSKSSELPFIATWRLGMECQGSKVNSHLAIMTKGTLTPRPSILTFL